MALRLPEVQAITISSGDSIQSGKYPNECVQYFQLQLQQMHIKISRQSSFYTECIRNCFAITIQSSKKPNEKI